MVTGSCITKLTDEPGVMPAGASFRLKTGKFCNMRGTPGKIGLAMLQMSVSKSDGDQKQVRRVAGLR
jgi:hypothetical protein